MSMIIHLISAALIFITILSCVIYVIPIPIQSVLCLVGTFVLASAVIVVIGAEFIGLIFIVVYVGAIAVLFLFVVMMLHANTLDLPNKKVYIPIQYSIIILLFICIMDINYLGTYIVYGNHGIMNVDVELAEILQILKIDLDNLVYQDTLPNTNIYFNNMINDLDDTIDLVTLGSVIYTYYGVYVIIAGFVLLVGIIGSIVMTRKVRTEAMAARQQAYQQTSRDVHNAIVIVSVK